MIFIHFFAMLACLFGAAVAIRNGEKSLAIANLFFATTNALIIFFIF